MTNLHFGSFHKTTLRAALAEMQKAAMDADDDFTLALRAAGQTRWMTKQDEYTDEVRLAYACKVMADDIVHRLNEDLWEHARREHEHAARNVAVGEAIRTCQFTL